MDQVLDDTDVASFLFKRHTRASAYQTVLRGRILVLSFMSVAELYKWSLLHNWGDNRKRLLQDYIDTFVTHPFTLDLSRIWAEISFDCQSRGHSISAADAWVAATAIMHGIPLATNNHRDFSPVSQLKLLVIDQ